MHCDNAMITWSAFFWLQNLNFGKEILVHMHSEHLLQKDLLVPPVLCHFSAVPIPNGELQPNSDFVPVA